MQWFNHLQVRTRFVVIGLFIAPFLLGLGSAGGWGIFQLGDILHHITNNNLPAMLYLGQTVNEVELVRISYRNMLLETDPLKIQNAITTTQETLVKAHKSWEQYTALPNDEEERALWPEFEANWKEWNNSIDEITRLSQLATPESRLQALEVLAQTANLGEKVTATLTELTNHQFDDATSLNENSDTTFNLVLGVLVGCAVGSILIISGAGLLLARSILELTKKLDQKNRVVSQALLDTQRTQRYGEDASNRLRLATSDLNVTTNQQANRSQEQAAAVIQVKSSLSELGETAQQIAHNSRKATSGARDGLNQVSQVRNSAEFASQTAQRGEEAVTSAIQSIEEVGNGISALAERLMKLTEHSHQISTIISIIREISDETHLLALNAAIESAGAGEMGQRFEVVAHEVKSLADRSLGATKEVSQMISELQGAVAAAVLASEETRKKTFGAVERSSLAGQVILELGQVVATTTKRAGQIVAVVEEITVLTQEISLATQQQESAVKQLIATMQGVGEVAQENATALVEVSRTVGQIEGLSVELKETLSKTNLELAML
jgi:methyl-accepting chemotaxis protein